MSFYLAIPSDSSQKFFPNNKISSYTTKVAKEIILYEDYEIGLSSIHFPLTYFNVKKDEFAIHEVAKPSPNNPMKIVRQIESVPEGRYPTETMVEDIFKRIPSSILDVQVSNVNCRTHIKVGKDCDLSFTTPLLDFLGRKFTPLPLKGNIFEKNTEYKGRHAIDYQRVCHNLYVYCDLIEPRTVGDTQVSLLATLPNPSGGCFGDTVVKTFDSIRYYKLGKSRFDTVKIDIVSDFGEHIPFESGRVFIELHFRKVKRE